MFSKIFKATKICITACYALIIISTQAFANEPSLAEAFESAANLAEGDRNQVSYKFENCVLQKVLTNLNYCEAIDQGEGHRVITTSIDFREVESISVSDVRGTFLIRFNLDFEGPGGWFLLADRLLNGKDGHFERFSERSTAALEEAELNSGKTYSKCDGTESQKSKEMSIALLTDLEPEGWSRIIDLARECRLPEALEFENRRSEN